MEVALTSTNVEKGVVRRVEVVVDEGVPNMLRDEHLILAPHLEG